MMQAGDTIGAREWEAGVFTQFRITNFRCFRDLQIDGLHRVNLIAGKNNTGKTALLEAIHLHSYPQDCQLPFTITEQRGVESAAELAEPESGWLFHTSKAGRASQLQLESTTDSGPTRTLRIAWGDAATIRQLFPATDRFVQGSFLEGDWQSDRRRMVMCTEMPGQNTVYAVSVPCAGGTVALGSSDAPWNGPSAFLGALYPRAANDVQAFSELVSAKRDEQVLPSLRLLEPRLHTLGIVLLGNRPVVHADVGLPRLVPVTLMGEGFRRTLAILSTIATTSGGRVLVDEIENGLHYSVMRDVWQAIAHAARAASVQVFATTHSWECIQAAHQAFTENGPYDLRLLRLDRADGTIRVAAYDQELLEYATEMTHEVR